MSMCRLYSTLLLWALLAHVAHASGLERFGLFLSGTQSARAEFRQKVTDRNGKTVQESQGTFAFQRPGRFRWTYEKPFAQVIVGDGQKLWILDSDLNQVTVRKLDQALGYTPAALLAGNNEVVKAFQLSELGARGGLEWVEAKPRETESSFDRVRLGFGFSGLEAMELRDNFGQTTELRFTSFLRNARVDAELFRFSPTKGADVIGDVK